MQAPSSNNARGVDVSHYQGDVDWAQVRAAGYCFAICKATEGAAFVDDRFTANVAGAREQGMAVGAYHFLRAKTIGGAQRAADEFLSAVESAGGIIAFELRAHDGSGPFFLDLETIEGIQPYDIEAVARAWIDRVKEATGTQPLLYTYPAFAQNHLSGALADVPLWYAYYSGQPADVAGWSRWTFLQTTDSGRVPGIDGPVDVNQYDGSEFDLIGYKMAKEDANKVIAYLSASYGATSDPQAQTEFHRLANELRKASGQPEE